jgi:hypothetical protein
MTSTFSESDSRSRRHRPHAAQHDRQLAFRLANLLFASVLSWLAQLAIRCIQGR